MKITVKTLDSSSAEFDVSEEVKEQNGCLARGWY